jgi:hypothetical protein
VRVTRPDGSVVTAEGPDNHPVLVQDAGVLALALVSNRIPGTQVDLSRFVRDMNSGTTVDKDKLLDRFVTLIVGGEISVKTRETLMKQLSAQVTLPAMPPAPSWTFSPVSA